MLMTASWFRSSRIDRIQGCGAIFALDGKPPRIVVVWPHCRKRSTDLARRRARDHQVAFAMACGHPHRHCARRPGIRRWSPPASNKKMERSKIKLDSNCPIQGWEGEQHVMQSRLGLRDELRSSHAVRPFVQTPVDQEMCRNNRQGENHPRMDVAFEG